MTMQQNFAMTPSVKNAISKVLRFILLPLRYNYRKRNGMKHALSPKREIPNDVLLGAVRETISQGHTATIIVKGWSMRPFLEHLRDKVQLDSPKCIQKYDAVLAEISSGKYVPHTMPPARTPGKSIKPCNLVEDKSESYLTIELQTRTGTAIRIQGVITPAHLRELIAAGNV